MARNKVATNPVPSKKRDREGDFSTVLKCSTKNTSSLLLPPFVADAAIPTPYLVSQFYRAPEVILGMSPTTTAIDIWSIGVTAAELFIRTVLFSGTSNSNMPRITMEQLRPFSSKSLRQHLI